MMFNVSLNKTPAHDVSGTYCSIFAFQYID